MSVLLLGRYALPIVAATRATDLASSVLCRASEGPGDQGRRGRGNEDLFTEAAIAIEASFVVGKKCFDSIGVIHPCKARRHGPGGSKTATGATRDRQ